MVTGDTQTFFIFLTQPGVFISSFFLSAPPPKSVIYPEHSFLSVIREDKTLTEKISPSDCPEAKCVGAFSEILVDVRGPNPLWAVPPPFSVSWIVWKAN